MSFKDDLEKTNNTVTMLWNMVYGVATKADILQALLIETLSTVDQEAYNKIMNDQNFAVIAEKAKASVQRRMDMMAFGEKEQADSAPLDQLIEDRNRVDET